MFAVKVLRRIRVSTAAADTSTRAGSGKFDCFQTWVNLKRIESRAVFSAQEFRYEVFDLRRFCQFAKRLRISGYKFCTRNIVAYALLGTASLWPSTAYCAISSNDYSQAISSGASPFEDKLHRAILLIRKLIVPVFLLFTVWLNWGQNFLGAQIALIFLSTKPIRSSVYVFVDQLRRQVISQRPHLYKVKPLQVKTIEVEDYMFLRLARVEIQDQQLVLIGILGSWWILPSSSWKEVFSLNKVL